MIFYVVCFYEFLIATLSILRQAMADSKDKDIIFFVVCIKPNVCMFESY